MAKGSILKKTFIVIGALFVLLIVAVITIPLFVDVDKYRPQIVQTANQHINGSLELGKLKLSLLGQVKIEVDGIQLSDARKRKILSVKDVYFHIPFLSLITFSPALELKMTNPDLTVVKDVNGKMNVLTLVKGAEKTAATPQTAVPATKGGAVAPKTTEEQAPVATAPTAKTESVPSEKSSLPSIATRASFGLQMKNARLLYVDEATQLKSEIRDLNMKVRNLSLSKPIDVEVTAMLDTKMGKVFVMKGPFELNAHMLATQDSFHLEKLVAKFLNAEVTASADVKNFEAPVYEFKVDSNEVDLKPWVACLPSLKEYELGGGVNLHASGKGTSAQPGYQAVMTLKDVTAKAPHFKAPMHLNGTAKIVPDRVDKDITLTAPGNELKMVATVVSFTKPNVTISMTSKGMDLDQWIDFPKSASLHYAPTFAAVGGAPETAPAPAAAPADYDALLDPLRENKIARDAIAHMKVRLDFLKAHGAKMTNVTADASMKNLAMNLESFKMGLFAGKVDANAVMDLSPKAPTYRFKANADGINTQEAVSSQMAMFKNTIVGIAAFKMEGTGRSFNPEPAMRNLEAKGNLKVADARFATIDIGKMVIEGLNKSIADIANRVPVLKGKTLGTPGNIDSKYSLISSDFTISKGVFTSPNFFAKAEPNKGLDIKGQTTVGLIDKAVNAKWDIIDTYNLTKARDLSVDISGTKVDHILADGNEPVKLPIEITGTLTAPKPSYTSIPEALGKVAVNNVGKAAVGKVKAEAEKKVTDALKKFGGGLFGK